MNSKDRRHSGRRVPNATTRNTDNDPEMEPQEYWDDWTDHRDGMRGTADRSRFIPDNSTIMRWNEEKFKKNNRKLKRRESIRRAMIEKQRGMKQ